MRYEDVHFSKFAVKPDEIISTLPQNQSHWSLDWEVVVVNRPTVLFSMSGHYDVMNEIKAWLKEQATARYEVMKVNDFYLVAFEDKSDAILFKISIDGAI